MSNRLLDHLLTRRSVQAAFLEGPGPNEEQIRQMLTIAARVPDHKKLEPWRFICFDHTAGEVIGPMLAARWLERHPDALEDRLEAEQGRFLRAPLVVAVVSNVNKEAPVPEWEQVLSAGAVCMNLVHAAYVLGFAAQWLTEWYAFDEKMLKTFGLKDGERLAGFIHIGVPGARPADRARPDLDAKVTHWGR